MGHKYAHSWSGHIFLLDIFIAHISGISFYYFFTYKLCEVKKDVYFCFKYLRFRLSLNIIHISPEEKNRTDTNPQCLMFSFLWETCCPNKRQLHCSLGLDYKVHFLNTTQVFTPVSTFTSSLQWYQTIVITLWQLTCFIIWCHLWMSFGHSLFNALIQH